MVAEELSPKVGTVLLAIIQPALGAEKLTRVSDHSPLELDLWRRKYRSAAKAAASTEALIIPGEHCLYCRAKPKCAAFHGMGSAIEPCMGNVAITGDRLSDIHSKNELWTAYYKTVTTAAKEKLEAGEQIAGWALKEGRKMTEIDTVKAIDRLSEVLPAEYIMRAAKLSLPQLADAVAVVKNLPKKEGRIQAESILGDAITTKYSAKTLTKI
jgi:hypothetical protein